MLSVDERVWQDKKAQRPRQRSKQRIREAGEDWVVLEGFGNTREQASQCSRHEVQNSRRDQFQKYFN
jgi:hypothetical protein